MLRSSGSVLPVEAFLHDRSEYEPYLCETVLPSLNARCLIIDDFLQPPASTTHNTTLEATHYQLKSLALLFCSFRHALFLDSDSIPLLDPAPLLTTSRYLSTGLIGWPDLWLATESPTFYSIAGLLSFPTDLPTASSEAGQLLLDKHQHLKTLLLACYYNIFGPTHYYPLLSQGALGQGDKNTFETAAVVLGAPFYRVPTAPRELERYEFGERKVSGLVQYLWLPVAVDGEGATVAPGFVHANTPKMNAGHLVDEGDLIDEGTEERLRLWGTTEEQMEVFGEDLEARVWGVMVEVGCALEKRVREWKGRKGLCRRLKEHKNAVFPDGG